MWRIKHVELGATYADKMGYQHMWPCSLSKLVESAVLLAVFLLCSSQYSRHSPHLVLPFKNCFRSAAVI